MKKRKEIAKDKLMNRNGQILHSYQREKLRKRKTNEGTIRGS
jgi:hypothetical protein